MNSFKILISAIVASPKLKKLWNHINNSFHQESPYAIVCTVIFYLPKLRKKFAAPNVNVFSNQSGKP